MPIDAVRIGEGGGAIRLGVRPKLVDVLDSNTTRERSDDAGNRQICPW